RPAKAPRSRGDVASRQAGGRGDGAAEERGPLSYILPRVAEGGTIGLLVPTTFSLAGDDDQGAVAAEDESARRGLRRTDPSSSPWSRRCRPPIARGRTAVSGWRGPALRRARGGQPHPAPPAACCDSAPPRSSRWRQRSPSWRPRAPPLRR